MADTRSENQRRAAKRATLRTLRKNLAETTGTASRRYIESKIASLEMELAGRE